VDTPQPASSAIAAIVNDIFTMKVPGKVCSPRCAFRRGELLIGRNQTTSNCDRVVLVAGGYAAGPINFS
jgi:hypothetical protein